METVVLPNQTAPQATGVVAPRTEVQQAQQQLQQIKPSKETSDQRGELRGNEEERFEAVRQAAQQASADIFAVSDVRFTIYKDSAPGNGELVYVTRFTSLRDGSVTVVPEPQLLTATGNGSGGVLRTLA